VVSEPQNPTAAKREYLPSRFHCYDIMTNAPSTEPTARKTNSKPFICPSQQQTLLVLFGRI